MKDGPVTLARFLWLDDAQQAASVLRGHGIECWVADRYFLSWNPHLSVALGGVRLRVRKSDLVDAKKILQREVWKEKVHCPNCDSGNVVRGRRCGWFAFGLFAFGLIPVRRLPRLWRCEDCGFRWKSRDGR